jgi:hypothetical protein
VLASGPKSLNQEAHHVHASTPHCSQKSQRLANKILISCDTRTSKIIK